MYHNEYIHWIGVEDTVPVFYCCNKSGDFETKTWKKQYSNHLKICFSTVYTLRSINSKTFASL